jgi:ABC-type branched-subunit amino acid transport system permease subunit
MSHLPRIVLYLGAAALVVLFPFVSPNEFYLRLAQDIAIWAIAAIGLNLLLGYSGQLSLGQSAFFALGAYGSGIVATTYHWPLWLSIPLGVLVASVAGVVIGLVALRARTHYLAMATLAFGFIIEILCQRWVGLTGGSMGLIGYVSELFASHRAFEFEFAQVLEVMNHFVHQDRLLCGSRSGPGIRKKDRFRGTLIQGDDLALVCRLNWLVDPGFARPIW